MARRELLAVVLCGAWAFSGAREAQGAPAVPGGQERAACGADLVKSLAGVWKAPEYKMKRASEVGTQVFGPNAFDITERGLDAGTLRGRRAEDLDLGPRSEGENVGADAHRGEGEGRRPPQTAGAGVRGRPVRAGRDGGRRRRALHGRHKLPRAADRIPRGAAHRSGGQTDRGEIRAAQRAGGVLEHASTRRPADARADAVH